MHKKLLFVASRQFWPTTGGKEITLYFNCKGLHEVYGYDIYLFCFADKNAQKAMEKPSFVQDLVYADIPSARKSFGSALKHSLGRDKWPIQSSLYYSKSIKTTLCEYYLKIQPDVVIIDMVRLVPYADALKDIPGAEQRKIILIEDDLLAKRYRRQIASSSNANMAGQYSNNLSRGFNKLVNLKFVKNAVLRYEAKRLDKYEGECVNKFDYITFISPIETDEFNSRYHTHKGVTLTMGADVEYYMSGTSLDYKPRSMSIIANFTTAANADSIEMICRDIITRLPSDVKYYVMGKCPDEIRNRLSTSQVEFLGFVDDIRSVAKETTLYLSPMAYGTGIKTKIVEAMAMGIPVVTNEIGAEGLAVMDGRELFICKSVDEMLLRINELFSDSDLRKRIAKTGQQFVLENHTWKKVYEAFEQMGL